MQDLSKMPNLSELEQRLLLIIFRESCWRGAEPKCKADAEAYKVFEDEILSRLASVPKWMPISEAPKDEIILLWDEIDLCIGEYTIWSDETMSLRLEASPWKSEKGYKPTHFMLLPTPPTEKD